MRRGLIAAIGIMLVAVTAAAPIASANHVELSQQEDYIGSSVGTPRIPTFFFGTIGHIRVRPLCDVLGTGINVGGACFDLDGRESELDIVINDIGHNTLWKVESKVDRNANQLLNPIDPALADLIEETISLRFVSGFVWFTDENGGIILGQRFCQSALHLKVPFGAAGVEVFLDGPLLGDPVAGTGNSIVMLVNDVTDQTWQVIFPGSSLRPVPVIWQTGCGFSLLGQNHLTTIPGTVAVSPSVGPTQATLGTINLVVQEDP